MESKRRPSRTHLGHQKRRGGLGEGVRRETAGGAFLYKFSSEARAVKTEREYREGLDSFFTNW